MVTVRGILGAPGTPGTQTSIVILGRIVTWHAEGISWESDPRHSDILIEKLVPSAGKGKVTTPSTRVKPPAGAEAGEHLQPGDVQVFRSLAMRANYLGQDRPDLQYACRELAKGMANPETTHLTSLKRLARYLRYRPRLVQEFRYQKSFTEIRGWSDADHAG